MSACTFFLGTLASEFLAAEIVLKRPRINGKCEIQQTNALHFISRLVVGSNSSSYS